MGTRGAVALLLSLFFLPTSYALTTTIAQLFGFPCNSQTLACPDGRSPNSLFQSPDGNFYGTAAVTQNIGRVSRGGAVFKVTGSGQFILLFTLTPDATGNFPRGDVPGHLVEGKNGSLYGVGAFGGTPSPGVLGEDGVIFEISKTGSGYQVLHNFCSFANCADGANPTSLILGNDGNFYGTAQTGGSFQGATCQTSGCGTVFRITPTGVYTVLHTFAGRDGAVPFNLTQASDGNFYGTTISGSTNVYRLTPSGGFSILHSFTSPDHPITGMTLASNGLLYGVSNVTGNAVATVFDLSTSGTFQQVAQITEPSTRFVIGKFMQASDGNLWTTSSVGGPSNFGTVFAITSNGEPVQTISFAGTNGLQPAQGVIQASNGNLYGTTTAGGTDSSRKAAFGVIFTLSPHRSKGTASQRRSRKAHGYKRSYS